ncbi:hypothetical protein IV102_28080 [bacterium]|nr:hypothetical protein [bacterium]
MEKQRRRKAVVVDAVAQSCPICQAPASEKDDFLVFLKDDVILEVRLLEASDEIDFSVCNYQVLQYE